MTISQLKKGHLIHVQYGHGSRILFAFHGFGQDKSFFKAWEKKLGKWYTIYAFDLFYHGESTRPRGKLSKAEWKEYLSEVIEKNHIESFSILGYSLGGRFAIATALSFPGITKELILIAPDGVFLTLWFKLATTPGTKLMFKYLMSHPDKLEKLIRFNKRVRIVNQYIADFMRKEMGTSESRKRIYTSWNHFKSLGYKRGKLIAMFRQHTFKRRIILGKKDYVINPQGILPIIDKMGNFEVHILDKKHHQLLDDEIVDLICETSNLNP
ncbi:MAG: alpha/beta hydrolase [Cyclobacteriaceae bacterium]